MLCKTLEIEQRFDQVGQHWVSQKQERVNIGAEKGNVQNEHDIYSR